MGAKAPFCFMSVPNNSNVYLPGTIQIPSSLEIDAITNAYPMKITISVDAVTQNNAYRQGQLVRLNIPYGYGMQQANGLTGKITRVDNNFIYLDIDSRNFDTFSVPSTGEMPATLAPSGSRNLQYESNDVQHVPFQCLNNRGN